MTDRAAPAASDYPASPVRSFNARSKLEIGAALVAFGAALLSFVPERGAPKIVPDAGSGAEKAVAQRLQAALKEAPVSSAPCHAYTFVNPDTRQKGVVEILGQPDAQKCVDLIVTGGGMNNDTVPASTRKGETRQVPVGHPMRYCPE